MPYFPDDDSLHSNKTVSRGSSLHASKTAANASRLDAHSCWIVVPCQAMTHSGWTVTRPVPGSQPNSSTLGVVVVVEMDVVVVVVVAVAA